jgi:hypothetical protein
LIGLWLGGPAATPLKVFKCEPTSSWQIINKTIGQITII